MCNLITHIDYLCSSAPERASFAAARAVYAARSKAATAEAGRSEAVQFGWVDVDSLFS